MTSTRQAAPSRYIVLAGGAALLTGFRGSPGVDRPALVDALLRLSRLAEDFPEIVALDINPLLALPPGRGVMALHARIRVRG